MFTPTRAYTQAELFVPLFVPPVSSDGPIYSSFKARPPPNAAQIAKTKSYLEIFHRKWDTLPDHIRATLSPPVPDLMPSGRVNASENSREPASNSVPAYSSSDEDDNEEVTTPSTFDASMVKDAIKRHLQKYSGAGRVVTVHICVNPLLLGAIKERNNIIDVRTYIVTPPLTPAGSIAPIDAMNAREIQTLVQLIEQDNELVCGRTTAVRGHEHVPLSRISLAQHRRPVISRHKAEPYGSKPRLDDDDERMQRIAMSARMKDVLEERWMALYAADSSEDESEDDILWMNKSKRFTK
ncbi:hypothetical protein QFC24_004019 [Naganishia onofrii]|uniref:Uncharacterized protein n=1 Tax=Naganishia onofrii TaxID=1851511 RepID=A0ACC2XIW8_9TREE|nr:hypothetical protein QFC24_004019 [Naganishia onofrii]